MSSQHSKDSDKEGVPTSVQAQQNCMLDYIKERYGPGAEIPPEEVEVKCTGGVQMKPIGAGSGE